MIHDAEFNVGGFLTPLDICGRDPRVHGFMGDYCAIGVL